MNSAFKYPALGVFFALALGITLGTYTEAVIPHTSLAIAVLASALCVLSIRKRAVLRIFIAIAGAVTLGFLIQHDRERAYQMSRLRALAELRLTMVWIEGTVLSPPVETSTSTRFPLMTDRVIINKDTITFQDHLQVAVAEDAFARRVPLPNENDHVRLLARLEPISDATNPHEPSYHMRLRHAESIRAIAYVKSPFDCYVAERSTGTHWFASIVPYLQNAARDALARAIPDENIRPFVNAIALGDRIELDHDLRVAFKRAGLAHLLAVSGFNVALVSIVVVQLLRLMGVARLRLRIVLCAVCVSVYCLVVGFSPSVMRAFIMIQSYFLARLLERRTDPMNILFGAATINLVIAPYDLFDAGFQLSYAAVFGLLATSVRSVLPGQVTMWRRIAVRSRQVLVASAAASLATAPILSYHFGALSPAGLITNIIAIPAVAIATVVSFLVIPLSQLSTALAAVYGEGLTHLTRLLLVVVDSTASLSISQVGVGTFHPAFALVVGVLMACLLTSRSGTRLAFRIGSGGAALLLWIGAGLPVRRSYVGQDRLTLTCFDVGQGDCLLISTPTNKHYFVDLGGLTLTRTKFEHTTMPFLDREAIRAIDGVFVTHMHADHYAGLAPLIANREVRKIYTSGERIVSPLAVALDRETTRNGIPVSVLSRGDCIRLDTGVSLYVLNPSREKRDRSDDLNHTSLAMKLVYGKTSVLLLGDIESSDEEELVAQFGTFLASDITKVAHHGSRTSSARALIDRAHSGHAVISVGRRNGFGHPARTVVNRWRAAGARIHRTDRDGAIMFRSDGTKFEQVRWKDL